MAYEDAWSGLNPVKLRQQLVHNTVRNTRAIVAPCWRNGLKLVKEDDSRASLARPCEKIPHRLA